MFESDRAVLKRIVAWIVSRNEIVPNEVAPIATGLLAWVSVPVEEDKSDSLFFLTLLTDELALKIIPLAAETVYANAPETIVPAEFLTRAFTDEVESC